MAVICNQALQRRSVQFCYPTASVEEECRLMLSMSVNITNHFAIVLRSGKCNNRDRVRKASSMCGKVFSVEIYVLDDG